MLNRPRKGSIASVDLKKESDKWTQQIDGDRSNYFYCIPPFIDVCENHYKACLMRKSYKDNKPCPCCSQEISEKLYPLSTDTERFRKKYGLGLSSYYSLLKSVTVYFGILLIPLGLTTILYGVSGDDEKIKDEYDSPSSLSQVSLANVGDNSMYKAEILNILTILIACLVWMEIMNREYKKMRTIKKKSKETKNIEYIEDCPNPTAADYSILVNYHDNQTSKFEINKFIEDEIIQKWDSNTKTKEELIHSSILPNDITRIKDFYDRILQLEIEKAKIDWFRTRYVYKYRDRTLHETNTIFPPSPWYKIGAKKTRDPMEYHDLIDQIKNEKNKFDNVISMTIKTNYCSIGFITFNKAEDSRNFLKDYKKRAGKYHFIMKYFKKEPVFSKGPIPSDVNWEKIGLPLSSKIFNLLIPWSCTILLLTFSFLVNYYLKKASDEMNSQQQSLQHLIAFISSGIITFVNKGIGILMIEMTKNEYFLTKTCLYISASLKMTILMYLNSAIFPLIIAGSKSDSFEENGMIANIFTTWLSIAFLQPIFEIFGIMYFLNVFKRWRLEKNYLTNSITQIEANRIFTPLQFNLPLKYAEMSLLMLYTFTFCSIFPLGIIISILGIITNFWVDKYLMLRRYGKPVLMTEVISHKFMILTLYIGIGLYYVFTVFWMMYFGDEYFLILVEGIIGFGFIFGCNYLLHKFQNKNNTFKRMLRFVSPSVERKERESRFIEKTKLDFKSLYIEDYKYYYPPTSKDARLALLERKIEKKRKEGKNVNHLKRERARIKKMTFLHFQELSKRTNEKKIFSFINPYHLKDPPPSLLSKNTSRPLQRGNTKNVQLGTNLVLDRFIRQQINKEENNSQSKEISNYNNNGLRDDFKEEFVNFDQIDPQVDNYPEKETAIPSRNPSNENHAEIKIFDPEEITPQDESDIF